MRTYFAYGANMHGIEMAERCPEAELIGPAVLKGYTFRIAKGGYGTVVGDAAGVVHGVLWTISPDDERSLDEYEGVPQGLYKKMNVNVEQPDGAAVNAFAYHAADETPGNPNPGYLETVLVAARSQQLPEEYVAKLEACKKGPTA
jgi:gamma-glutamylcyclotransferase (GGCT)/AIG2-like uncharacterized protein YtfP